MEYKLRRRNGISQVDNASAKTLYAYLGRIANVNLWFKNKPLVELTEDDIRRVYDGLEDGTILTQKGQRFEARVDYYNKVFKSKLFEMAGKADLAKKVIEFIPPGDGEVRFVEEDAFLSIAAYVFRIPYRLLLWLAFDIGENINSLLQLKRSDFYRQTNPNTGEPEYRVRLRKELLKRSRTARSEITNFSQTTELLDMHLMHLEPDQELFGFGYRAALKFFRRAVERSGALCTPLQKPVIWKDLRSGMACNLLMKQWTVDEVKARLGHHPSSKEIDKYVTYLALNRHVPKAKVRQFEMQTLQTQLEESKSRERLAAQRLMALESKFTELHSRMAQVAEVLQLNPTEEELEMAIAQKSLPESP